MQLETKIAHAETLVMALENCPPGFALPIVDEYIAVHATNGPFVSLDLINADAAFWAETAPTTEIRVYAVAMLKRMSNEVLGRNARKQHLVAVWNTTAAADRQAFLARVDAAGNFRKVAA